ncbi:MAG TPA: hypothetical protein VI685_14515, partial [Candidatus Angelobacter sp.]
AVERAKALIVDYVLGYLLDQKHITKATYNRLVEGRKFIYLSHLPKDHGTDEELFTQYATGIQPEDFVTYLTRTKFAQESATGSSDPLDKLSIEVIRDFRQWLPDKIQRGTETLKIPELPAGETRQITTILQFPGDVSVSTHNLELVTTSAHIDEAQQTTIQLPVEISDKWHWLKIALFTVAGVIGVAIVRVVVKWLFDVSIAGWLTELYERYIRKRRWLSSELVSADCEIWPPKGNEPSRLLLDAEARIQNRQDTETSIRCRSCKIKAGKIVEDFRSVELKAEKKAQTVEEVPLAARSSVQVSIHCAKDIAPRFQEALPRFPMVSVTIVFDAAFGAITTMKSQIAWSNPHVDLNSNALPISVNHGESSGEVS